MESNKIFIGVPTSDGVRWPVFYDYLQNLDKPEGTMGAGFHTNSGAMNRNLIIQEALFRQCTHVLFIDDDMAFAPNALMKLLEHNKDIVSGLFLKRVFPHPPVIFYSDGNGKHTRRLLKDNDKGLIHVDATGFGFTLVKTSVFALLEKPYIRLGEINPERRSEDIGFCKRARSAGFSIYCDLDCPIGHIGQATFWPHCIGGVWHTAIDTDGNEVINTLQPKIDSSTVVILD